MKLNVTPFAGFSSQADVDASDAVFGVEFNEPLVHQIVVAYQAGGRAGTRAQKTRAEVSGSTRKPWRQKGSGQARAGSIRSPLWRGGGKVFAARTQDFSQKVNRKMYRAAIRNILSELARQQRLVMVEDISVDTIKTKTLSEMLGKLQTQDALIITAEQNRNLSLSARNLPKVDVCDAGGVDPVSLIRHEKVIVTIPALKRLEEIYA